MIRDWRMEKVADLVYEISKKIDHGFRELNSAEIAFACECVAQAHRELFFKGTWAEHFAELQGASVEELYLSARASNALNQSGIRTIAQLEALSDGEILRMPNVGRMTLDEIKQELRQYRERKSREQKTGASQLGAVADVS